MWFDLLDPKVEDQLLRDPSIFGALIEARLQEKPKLRWVVVDEVQKAPRLLDTVHRLIESEKLFFVLTGSSSRRLKQKGVNLLAGRAFERHLMALSAAELRSKASFDLSHALRFGTLPNLLSLKTNAEKMDYLTAYSLQYIQLEIQHEQWVRKLAPFRRFLPVAAQMNGKILNFSRIAQDVGVDTTTIQSYYEILEDTLLGKFVYGFDHSIRKQMRKAPKFYFFDVGVKRAVSGEVDIPVRPGTSAYGEAFEHWFYTELDRVLNNRHAPFRIQYLLTKDQAEVDFVVTRPGSVPTLIEVKSTDQVNDGDARTLNRFADDFKGSPLFLASRDPVERKFGKVWALPWEKVIHEIEVLAKGRSRV